jgi:hypothetical protein
VGGCQQDESAALVVVTSSFGTITSFGVDAAGEGYVVRFG